MTQFILQPRFDITPFIQLNNEIRITSFYNLPVGAQPLAISILPGFVPLEYPLANDSLPVVWQQTTTSVGYNYTQLEWTWLEDELAGDYPVDGNGNVAATGWEQLFTNNATRLDLPVEITSYNIPLLYDGQGKLYYRIRPANIDAAGSISFGQWTPAQSFSFGGHNPALNWQATTSYAEGGKRKSVIQYYDGTLRSRQTVTKDNTTNTTVVAETFYDNQGRPAVQILPAPTINNVIAYQAGLNQFNNSAGITQNPADLFDLVPVQQNPSTPDNGATPGLSSASGASLYYSPANTEISNGLNKLLPDAQGYPYTVTRYTPDATGRVMTQSGVGDAMKMGNGHETNYYYGTAPQEELDGLFGTEAGDNTHYFKNMVQDANGQMSVSYVDMHGRTIATALAGSAPASLTALNNNDNSVYPNQSSGATAPAITQNLLGTGNVGNIIKNNTLEAVNTLLVPVAEPYVFKYALTPQSLAELGCNSTTLCYGCQYDLQISVTDESGRQQPMVWSYTNVQLSAPGACTASNPPAGPSLTYVNNTTNPALDQLQAVGSDGSITITINPLAVGSYAVRKTLTLSQSALQAYQQQFVTAALCKTQQQIIDSVFLAISGGPGGCKVPADPSATPCSICLSQLPDKTTFLNTYYASEGVTDPSLATTAQKQAALALYNAALQHCQSLCNTYDAANPVSNRLNGIKAAMLADMAPYTGQYALPPAAGGSITNPCGTPSSQPCMVTNPATGAQLPYGSMYDKYNIFSVSGIRLNPVTNVPYYKYPLAPFYPGVSAKEYTEGYYLDANGNDDVAITPGNEATPYTILNGTTPDGFNQSFRPSWRTSLLQYHPEYGKLQFALKYLVKVYAWADQLFMGTSTYSQANTYSASNTTGNNFIYNPVSQDPYFTVNTADVNKMNGYINSSWVSGQSLWQLAYNSVACKGITDNTLLTACQTGNSSFNNATAIFGGGSSVITTTDQKDQVWTTFKALYMSARESLINAYIDANAHLPSTGGTNDADLLVAQGYILHFPRDNNQMGAQSGMPWLNNPDAPATTVTTNLPTAATNPDVQVLTTGGCAAYVPNWVQALLQCPTIANLPVAQKVALLNEVTSRMQALCQAGTNAYNPFGASTLAPGAAAMPNGDISFEQIIRDVLVNEYNIPVSQLCNAYVIQYPKPYSKGPLYTSNNYTNTVDTCICHRFAKILANAAAAGITVTDYTSFNNYLQQTYGQTITQELYNGLGQCSTLNQPAPPPTCTFTDFGSSGYPTLTNTPAPYGISYSDFNAQFGTLPPPNYQTIVFTNNTYYFPGYHEFDFPPVSDLDAPGRCNYLIHNLRQETSSATPLYPPAVTQYGQPYNFDFYFYVNNTYVTIVNDFDGYQINPGTSLNPSSFPYQTYYLACPVTGPEPFACTTTPPLYAVTLPSPQPLPAFLTCGYVDGASQCLTCAGISGLTAQYKSIFSGQPCAEAPVLPGSSNLTAAQVSYNVTWQNYINFQTGFQYNWQTYMQAAATGNQPPVCASCAALQQLVHNYFGTLAYNAGSEANMLTYIQSSLSASGQTATVSQIQAALAGCNNGWQQNVAITGGGVAGVAVPQGIIHKEDFSIEIWVNPQQQTTNQQIVVNSMGYAPLTTQTASGYQLYLLDGYVYWRIGDWYSAAISGISSTNYTVQIKTVNQLSLNQWHHIVAVRVGNNAASFKIYVDGVLQTTVVTDKSTLVNGDLYNEYNSSIIVGNGSASGGEIDPLQGLAKNFRLYRRVLTDAEVTANYNDCTGSPTNTSNLLLWFKFNEGTGTTALDYSSYGTNASLPAWQWSGGSGDASNGACTVQNAQALCTNSTQTVACNLNNYATNSTALQDVICPDNQPLDNPVGLFVNPGPCATDSNMAINIGTQIYLNRVQTLQEAFKNDYANKCISSAFTNEQFSVTYKQSEYHYTLYYYDMAGNLVKTVPPKGVHPIYGDNDPAYPGFETQVKNARLAGNFNTPVVPPHTLFTRYWYNSLNRVVTQSTPDAGYSSFWYDALGRLAVSQNAKQAAGNALLYSTQGAGQQYSYTLYDNLGRITEVGQLVQANSMQQSISQNNNAGDPNSLLAWINAGKTTGGEQITQTIYDAPYSPLNGLVFNQHNLRNRVSYVRLFNTYADYSNTTAAAFANATYYTYDIHGNVDTLVQDYGSSAGTSNIMNSTGGNGGNRFKRIVYNYDLISGKVNMVCYQPRPPGQTNLPADAFYHRYQYDAENRITNVYTSRDSIYWERDANYSYYKHGPLAQTVLGQQQVQGVTYAYTLQGWLKGINPVAALPVTSQCQPGTASSVLVVSTGQTGAAVFTARELISFDPGYNNNGYPADAYLDGNLGACVNNAPAAITTLPNGNSVIPAAQYQLALNYYDGDYANINAGATPVLTTAYGGVFGSSYRPLYNGNISSMGVNITQLNNAGSNAGGLLYNYGYDQLNRLVRMDAYNIVTAGNNAFNATTDYAEQVSYDPNGNILTYNRNGNSLFNTSKAIDNLTYKYEANAATGAATSNKLRYIYDDVKGNPGTDDIKTQTSDATQLQDVINDKNTLQAADNYGYDAIGNLIKNAKEGISAITWTVYGKINSITKTDGTTINYTYDVAGNRISKTVHAPLGDRGTWYVRDASGNVMSIYTAGGGSSAANGGNLTVSEVPLYGSSRLGEYKTGTDIQTAPENLPVANTTLADGGKVYLFTFTRGQKLFELSNHLGNVLVTVSDKKIAVDNGVYSNGIQTGTTPDGIIDYYNADVVSANDYYPFGMMEPGRQYNAGAQYRYGFNGKENDNDIEIGAQDYGMRIYDARIGQFLTIDPLNQKFPWFTPYEFAGNNPNKFIDVDGMQEGEVETEIIPELDVENEDDIYGRFSVNGNGVLIYTPPSSPSPTVASSVGPAVMGVYSNPVWIDEYGNNYVPTESQRANYLKTKLAQAKSLQYAIHHLSPQIKSARINENLHKNAAVLPSTSSFSSNYNQRIATNPSDLSDGELAQVAERLKNGTATTQDYLYEGEIAKRRAASAANGKGSTPGNENPGNLNEALKNSEDHIFSESHAKAGIYGLGNSKGDILNRIGNVVKKNFPSLKEGYNRIVTKMNNQVMTVRVYIKDGKILSVNAFTGLPGSNKKENIIDLTKK